MNITIIPLLTALIPIVGINIAYIIAASLEHVPACFIYFEGCTTISSTGRSAPESLWFRATIIPGAVLTVICWRLIGGWLKCLEKENYKGSTLIQTLGILAGLFLIFYTVALGFIGSEYTAIRRTGVTLFFGFTFLAQLLLAQRLWKFANKNPDLYPKKIALLKIVLCWFLLIAGLISIPVSNYIGTDEPQNIVEWIFSILLYSYFLLVYWAWRATGYRANLETG
ncbi:MAG: hypothetical protein GY744_06805 [Gammaproteobacteria bacterium]|nr:hypothetical protein [Gammaproteobacteria bacterium]